MFNHQPADYSCPFCKVLDGSFDDHTNADDIVYRNQWITAIMSPRWWPRNPGNVVVITNKHFENIYDVPDDYIAEIYKAVKLLAAAIRSSYDCQGISSRQHNEPAGNQDVWHFHAHIFPRYDGDELYASYPQAAFVTADQRRPYADKIRNYLKTV